MLYKFTHSIPRLLAQAAAGDPISVAILAIFGVVAICDAVKKKTRKMLTLKP